jgi:hypothetical protein
MRAHQLLDSFFLQQDCSGLLPPNCPPKLNRLLPQSLPQGYWLLPLTFWRAEICQTSVLLTGTTLAFSLFRAFKTIHCLLIYDSIPDFRTNLERARSKFPLLESKKYISQIKRSSFFGIISVCTGNHCFSLICHSLFCDFVLLSVSSHKVSDRLMHPAEILNTRVHNLLIRKIKLKLTEMLKILFEQ